MNAIKKGLLIICSVLLVFQTGGFAQDDDPVKSMRAGQLRAFGKSAFKQGDYSSAAMYFESYRDKRPKNYKIVYQLAESYRLSKDYREAEKMYLKAYQLNPKKNALALFHYATMLKNIGNFSKSDEYYAKFKKEYKGKDKSAYLKMIGNNTKATAFVSEMMDKPLNVKIDHLDSTINTHHVEAGPVFINDSTMIYSSLKTDQKYFYMNTEDSSSNEPFRKLYTATKENDKWITKGLLDGPFNAEGVHNSNVAFSKDGQRIYFSRCKRNRKNKNICALYVSNLNDGNWSEPVSLGDDVNLSGFTSTQPTVATEAKKNREIIYFVSDRENGRGGMDIWYTYYDSKLKIYKPPSNAGSKINTAGDEMTPYYDYVSGTLFFSSDGFQGLGGLDIFKTNGEMKRWSIPQNLGAPLNSSYDDLYYSQSKSSSEYAMMVSNREVKTSLNISKGCCDDIFSIHWLDAIMLEVKGSLYETSDTALTSEGIPVKGAKVFLEMKNPEDTTFIPINGIFTDLDGKYKMVVLPDREYRLTTKKEGYLSSVREFSTIDRKKNESIEMNIGVKEAPFDAIGLKNIYYEYGKATLTQAAMNSIDTTLLIIMQNNPDLVIEISSHTDHVGSDAANEILSQERAQSVVDYLVKKGIEVTHLNARGYGESQPIAPNQFADGTDNAERRQLNRRTEFRIIGKMRPDGKIQEPGIF
ncbi:MAG: OmpA family protein [Bacteroidetes bacterium]|nr:OmpA family protein [Bacteroidota bacterium]